MVNLIDTAGLGDVEEQDVEELQQVSGESLPNDDLQELAEQGIHDFRLILGIVATWKDPRLNLKKFVTKDFAMFPSKLVKYLWKPRFSFPNTKMIQTFYDSSKITFVRVLPDEALFGGLRMNFLVDCPMKLHNYPLDVQICQFTLCLSRHSDKEIQLKWMGEENSPYKNLGKSIHVRHMNLLTYEMDEVKAKKVTQRWLIGNFTILVAEFKFKRRLTGNLMNVYIPSTLVVMLSWLSFWIDVHAAPARVTLGVTSILTLVTHLVQSRSFVPPVDYLKALDVWFIFCIVLIFLSLLEYAVAYQSAIKMKEVLYVQIILLAVINDIKKDLPASVYISFQILGIDKINEATMPSRHGDTLLRGLHSVLPPPARYSFYTLYRFVRCVRFTGTLWIVYFTGTSNLETNSLILTLIGADFLNFWDFRLLLAIIAAWKDPRLNLKKFVAKDSVMFPSKLEKNLWKPKFVFLNTKMVEKFYDSSRITSVKVLPDESLFGGIRMNFLVDCPMKLHDYPLIFRFVNLNLLIGRHSDKEIQLKWMGEENSPYKNLGKSIHVRHMNLLTYEMDEIKAKKVTEQWLTGNHTLLIAEFKFKRRLTGNLMNVYIPSTLVVMLSWLSFWIDVHAAPARVTLGVTSILTLVTHLVQSRSFVPPVDYLKALDIWFIFCIVLIFLSLLEYALAYQSAIKMKERKEIQVNSKDFHPKKKKSGMIRGLFSHIKDM
ncbi:uncharacterized protein [Centruroides vittatus]|uniref:uncharacterized protein n=1 Tax=Centruroides vittatus TaxID=120091 RepID=UPI00351025DE